MPETVIRNKRLAHGETAFVSEVARIDGDESETNLLGDLIAETFGQPEPEQVYTAVTSFESQNLDAWAGVDSGEYSWVTTPTPTDGTYALQKNAGSNGNLIEAYPGATATDLPYYPTIGDTIYFDCRTEALAGNNMFFGFGMAATGYGNDYKVQIDWNDDDLFLQKDGGTGAGVLANHPGPVGYAPNQWYCVEIVWDDGTLGGSYGDITVSIYEDNPDGAQVGSSITANDTEWGLAEFEGLFLSMYAPTGVNQYFDNFRVIQ